MKEFRKSLPPLHALVAFEAAARLSSFSAAAQELNVSQAAVSQQVRNLEDSLGLALFNRTHKAVQLTHLGREYQHTVAAALQHLATATQELRMTRGRDRLTVAADQSMAWMWLMPRLGHFYEVNAGVSVRVVVSDLESDCLADSVDVALVHGEGVWPGRQSALLFVEEVYPVCSPSYLASASPLEVPSDLIEHTLLHLEDDHWEWMNWRMWLTENGVAFPANQHGLTINNYPLLIEAAKKGQGLALGWKGLVDRELDDGRLVRPLKESVQSRYGYYAVWLAAQAKSPQTRAFVDWVSRLAAP
ncbi:transcriptional regulator GcvA [Rhodospirillaceae bacterium SYSU D60014]|uniref:transcriptional regulator GcvA n=1 Tax=Virgifigura deserti TaxID=2268457 RepID=UPI000E6657F6